MKDVDLKDLIYGALVDLSYKYDQHNPYEYLEKTSFHNIATDLAYELEQMGVNTECPPEENNDVMPIPCGE